ncbi:phage tail tape measure protein, TP901 family, core region [Pseudomonas sp. NFACC32-1]|uniref:phage tail tape measure protein n=1 Tax=unclassified Pseudomonas TaxID=196821 RepID=UPI000876F58E|nr:MULTISPECIES: phage tail tape measure protein [unclassified Pseudomonas]MDB6446137.1 phage tail tape measure protein [Pseudomonas sp. 21TX0197]ROO38539.1 phage tail tape measure protein [Pseudomonas sp. 7SR1]SCX70972.1 phage tail tape measure protein, TP901 family, core region [Pseudomonas sp. NFACC32-1]SFW97956.1 phage tail tape measure protein, TP901 family, core region [Pseudomonas sp. NFACC36]SIR87515.1 phage tail tape measure protein, TP901 family, core region [Pseudomonas sp. 7SR1]
MADSKYSLSFAASVDMPTLGSVADASGLNLALSTASLDIRLLVSEQVKLRETLATLNTTLLGQQLLKVNAAAPAANAEPKSKLRAEVDQLAPPDVLKPAMAMQTAMVDLNQKLRLSPEQLQVMANENQKIAGEKQTASSGATAVQLAQIQLAAVNAGLVKNVKPEDRQQVLTDFARDSAVMASAYKIELKDAGALMAGLRTSLNLDRGKSLELGNAANRLGASASLQTSAADIGSVAQRGGKAGIEAGMTPEQIAAIAAALLNASVGKDEASASLKILGTALGKGDKVTPEQRTAWARLDIEPGALASRLRTDASGAIKDVLATLQSKPAEQQASLLKTLFDGDEGIGKLLKSPEDLKTALTVASDKGDGDKGAMAQTADTRGNTSQARWNALDASVTRLDTAIGSAVTPITDLAMLGVDALATGLSVAAESLPKITAALALFGAALASPFRGAIVDKVTSGVASTREALLKPDAAIQPAASDASGTQAKDGGQKQPGAGTAETSRPDMRSRLGISAARARTFTGRLGAPLVLASAGYDGVKALQAGDYKAASGAAGAGLGGLAGGYAGAATGAMLGSFVPVIGTAIGALVGGALGSYLGSKGGESLGEAIYTGADRLKSPDQVNKDLVSTMISPQQNTMTANIYINGQDQASASQLANLVVQQLAGQFALTTVPNSLAMRSDAALTDGGR